ncbi:MAG: organomercurial lyase [Ignavibacteria bacterium]|nr:organomercurial lyase [Ignavibacteria bacterium]
MDEETRHQAVLETLSHIAARWADADKRVLRFVFPMLAKGKPVTIAHISEAAHVTPLEVVRALELGRAGRDADGHVVELSGLTLNPTMHRVQIGDVALFSCCALLAQLTSMLVDKSVRIESVDPVSRRLVRTLVERGSVTAIDPPEAMSSFVQTDAPSVLQDAGESFCRHVHYFASSETASTFIEADDRRYVLTIPDLHEAARHLYKEVWAP